MSLKVLILEDDNNLATSLEKFFSNVGFTVTLSSNVKDAKQNVFFGHYDLLLVDLVLPKPNGVDFLHSIIEQKKLSNDCKVWVMSGVLKKRVLSKNILAHVDEFFPKPLDFKIIKQKVDSSFKFVKKDTVFNFFYMTDHFSVQNLFDKQRLIESHQLMFIYFYLFRHRFTGILNLSYIDNEQVEIFFKNGYINHIRMDDKNSYLGVLLLKRKLATVEQIKNLLMESSDAGLGEKVILNRICSLEDVQKVLREQLLIRLYKTLGKSQVVVTSRKDIQIPMAFSKHTFLALKDLLSILDNWMYFKVDIEWLKSFFAANMHCVLQPVGQIESSKMGRYSKIVKSILEKPIRTSTTIEGFLNRSSVSENEVFYEIYIRLLIRNCVLKYSNKGETQTTSYDVLRSKLQVDFADADQKNYFDWLNVSHTADSNEIERQYKKLIKMIHADRRNKNLPGDIERLYDRYFVMVKESYEFLMNEDNRKKYIIRLNAKVKSEVSSQYALAKQHLKSEEYTEALKLFKTLLKNKHSLPDDMMLYYIWAYLKFSNVRLKSEEDMNISKLFEQIPTRHRQSALFFFIKGLYMKRTENMDSAYDFLSKAISINPQLFPAYKERHAVNKLIKKNKKSFFSFFKTGA